MRNPRTEMVKQIHWKKSQRSRREAKLVFIYNTDINILINIWLTWMRCGKNEYQKENPHNVCSCGHSWWYSQEILHPPALTAGLHLSTTTGSLSTKDKQNKASETPEEECWADLGVSLQHPPWLWEEKKKRFGIEQKKGTYPIQDVGFSCLWFHHDASMYFQRNWVNIYGMGQKANRQPLYPDSYQARFKLWTKKEAVDFCLK